MTPQVEQGVGLGRERHSEAKVAEILGRIENGEAVAAVSRATGIGRKTIQQWRARYGRQPGAEDARRVKQLEDENARLKKLVADMALVGAMLKDVLGKRW